MAQDTAEGREGANALELLQRLKTEVFLGDNDVLALGLGRTAEEVEAWLSGAEEIDEDGEMKIHGLAQERLGE